MSEQQTNAQLRAELAAERELREQVSEALGKMIDAASRLAKLVEYYEDQRR